ncbi:MAG TPA: hypothetical protein ENK28_14680 [Aliiroseovarius sp.]|nr:hypothetical protein [Aliiroseovarius sp.]
MKNVKVFAAAGLVAMTVGSSAIAGGAGTPIIEGEPFVVADDVPVVLGSGSSLGGVAGPALLALLIAAGLAFAPSTGTN